MPERRNSQRSLVPLKDGGMLRTADFQGYSQDQIRQLERATGGYLRYYKLPVSFLNFSQAQPGIKGCVEEGLEITYGRQEVKPGDDLLLAYAKGFELRKQRTQQARLTVEQLHQDPTLAVSLAIRPGMVDRAETEIAKPAFNANFIHNEKLAGLIAVRKPIFGKLVLLVAVKAEELIPGAGNVHLTSFQQACLVRNMLAGIYIYGEPKIFLEVKDFTLNKESFTQMQNRQTFIAQISKMINIKSPEAEAYLDDLLSQISFHVASLGDLGQHPTLQQLNTAYRRLSQAFLVTNPFDALINLSEEGDNSIWGEQRSTVLTINGADYRVPWPKDLNLLAIKLESDNPTRSSEARQAAASVERLFEDYQKYQDSSQLLVLQARREEASARLEEQKQKIIQGKIPEDNRLSQEYIKKSLSRELAATYDNIERLTQISQGREKIVESCLQMLKQIQRQTSDGKRDNFSRLLERIPSIESRQLRFSSQIRTFLNWQVLRRLRTSREFFHEYDIVSSVFPSLLKSESSDPFERALSCTSLDCLVYQSDLWRVRQLFQDGALHPIGSSIFWLEQLIIEQQSINQTLLSRADEHIRGRKIPYRDFDERDRIIKNLAEEQTDNLLGTKDDPLAERIKRTKAYQATLETGKVPENQEILLSSTTKLLDSGLEKLREIIAAQWSKQENRYHTATLPERMPSETAEEPSSETDADITKEIPDDQTDYRYFLTSKVIGILARVPPFLPSSSKGISSFVLGRYPDYLRYDQSQSSHDSSRITDDYVAEIRSMFTNLLADHGLNFSQQEIMKMVTRPRIALLKDNTALYTDLTAITPELLSSYKRQIPTLEKQMEDEYIIYKQDPDKYLKGYRRNAGKAEQRYTSYVGTLDNALGSRLKQLRHLGFLRTELQG